MNLTSVIKELTDKNIKFELKGIGNNQYFCKLTDLGDEGITTENLDEAILHLEKILNFAKDREKEG